MIKVNADTLRDYLPSDEIENYKKYLKRNKHAIEKLDWRAIWDDMGSQGIRSFDFQFRKLLVASVYERLGIEGLLTTDTIFRGFFTDIMPISGSVGRDLIKLSEFTLPDYVTKVEKQGFEGLTTDYINLNKINVIESNAIRWCDVNTIKFNGKLILGGIQSGWMYMCNAPTKIFIFGDDFDSTSILAEELVINMKYADYIHISKQALLTKRQMEELHKYFEVDIGPY